MKQTILVCDLCHEPRRNAVTSLALTNGKQGGPALDLCATHELKIRRIFASREKQPRGGVLKYNPIQVEKAIMTFLTKHGTGSPTPIARASGIPRWTIQAKMLKLLKSGKLKSEGKGKQAVYRKA
jgi:hypothetical protein